MTTQDDIATYMKDPAHLGDYYGPGMWKTEECGVQCIATTEVFNNEWHGDTGESKKTSVADLVEPADDETAAKYGWVKKPCISTETNEHNKAALAQSQIAKARNRSKDDIAALVQEMLSIAPAIDDEFGSVNGPGSEWLQAFVGRVSGLPALKQLTADLKLSAAANAKLAAENVALTEEVGRLRGENARYKQHAKDAMDRLHTCRVAISGTHQHMGTISNLLDPDLVELLEKKEARNLMGDSNE